MPNAKSQISNRASGRNRKGKRVYPLPLILMPHVLRITHRGLGRQRHVEVGHQLAQAGLLARLDPRKDNGLAHTPISIQQSEVVQAQFGVIIGKNNQLKIANVNASL